MQTSIDIQEKQQRQKNKKRQMDASQDVTGKWIESSPVHSFKFQCLRRVKKKDFTKHL